MQYLLQKHMLILLKKKGCTYMRKMRVWCCMLAVQATQQGQYSHWITFGDKIAFQTFCTTSNWHVSVDRQQHPIGAVSSTLSNTKGRPPKPPLQQRLATLRHVADPSDSCRVAACLSCQTPALSSYMPPDQSVVSEHHTGRQTPEC